MDYSPDRASHIPHIHIYILPTHVFLNTRCFLELSLQTFLSLVKKNSMPQSVAPTTCSPAAANLPRTSTVVMISSLQCFWQVWLSASLPELNSLHSIQSLQEHTQRGRLSTRQKLHEHRDSALGKGFFECWSGGCTSHHKERAASGASISIPRMDLF